MSPPDALREALGQVIADQRREWRREREVIEAQSRQAVAELRAQIVEMEAELRAKVDARLAEVKDGAPGAPGERGEQGPAGERGPQGEQGLQGEPGAPGAQGERGDTGAQGDKGDAGLPGERGETGERGPAGERGDAGTNGADGAPGPMGERGAPGDTGERGEQGAQGVVGESGERGETGQAGERGPQGEQGLRGDPGPQGERGIEGAHGKLPAVGEWEDRVYRDADVVTFGGAVYQAHRDTGKAPPHDDWICIVPAGRDGKDGRSINPRGTWAQIEMYNRLDVVTLDGGAFVAKRDDPGSCPGEGWQLIVQRGKAGIKGEKGDAGAKGDRGAPGPAVVGIGMDDTGLVTLTNADGTTPQGDFGPALSRIR